MAKKDLQFSVDVNGNISGLNKAMNEATALMRRTANTIKNIDMAVKDDPNNLNLLKERRDKQIQYIEDTKKALKELQAQQKALVLDKNFKKGVTDGLEFSKLTKEISKTKKELKDAKKDLNDMNLAVSNFTFDVKMRKVTEELQKAKSNLDKVNQSLNKVNDGLQLDPYNVDLYAQKQVVLKDKLEAVRKELDLYNKQKDLLENPLFRKQTEDEVRQLEEVKTKIVELRVEEEKLASVNRNQLDPSVEAFSKRMETLSDRLTSMGNATYKMSKYMQGFLVSSFDLAKQYESNLASIEKVTGKLSDDIIVDLKNLAIETGNSFDKISEYATISGALGLTEDEIVSFTKAMLDLNAVSGGAFSGEEGAKGIAVFLNQLNLGIEEAENFGSAIAVIGDKYADIGDETVNVATKISGLSAIIDTNQYELLGLAGVMADLGLSSDTSANAINRAFLQIESALSDTSEKGVKKWKALAETSGMTVAQFKKEWGEDAVNTFLKFTDGLKSTAFNEINDAVANSTKLVDEYAKALGITSEEFKTLWGKDSKRVFEDYIEQLGNLGEENESASLTLKTLGISSVNTAQTLLRLAGSGNDVREAIKLTTEAWNENTALQEKTSILYGTTQRKLESFMESLKQLKATLIESVLPTVKDMLDSATDMAKAFGKLPDGVKKLILSFISLGAVTSPVFRTMGSLSKVVASFTKPLDETSKAIDGVSTRIKALNGIAKFINTPISTAGLLGGIGAITVAIAGLGYYAYQNNPLKLLREEYEQLNQTMSDNMYQSDLEYSMYAKQLDMVDSYAGKIDELTAKLNDNTLSQDEKLQIYNKIESYVSSMNEALGSEELFFDRTTGKIMYQGEKIDEVKGKFDQLAFEAKKQAWLSAHQDNLEEAYRTIDTVIDKEAEATAKFQNAVKDIPQAYVDVFTKYDGDLTALKEKFGGFYDTGELNAVKSAWDEYVKSIQESETMRQTAQENIDNYEAVAQSTIENFDSVVTTINTKVGEFASTLGASKDDLKYVNDTIDILKGALTDEQEMSNTLLQSYESQKGTLEYNAGLLTSQLESILGIQEQQELGREAFRNNTIQDYIDMWNAESGTIPSTVKEGSDSIGKTLGAMFYETNQKFKSDGIVATDELVGYIEGQNPTMHVNVVANGNLNFGGSGTTVVGNGGGYRTQVPKSSGFGIDGVIGSLSRSFANMNSGGFRSRGIYLTTNFTINNATNLSTKSMAQEFARNIVDELNNQLGMEI